MNDITKHPRVIVRKGEIITIPDDAVGIPIEEYWPDTKLPDGLKGASVFEIEDNIYIARKLPDDENIIPF